MSRSRFPFAGRGEATAFLIDPRLVGTDEATRRVVEHWVDGTSLLEFEGRWLLVLPSPISVRAEHAPGLPIPERSGRLAVFDGGREVGVAATDRPQVDLVALLDLDGIDFQQLRPVAGQIPPTQPVPEPPRPAPPPLRQRAGVGSSDTAMARSAASLQAAAQQAKATPRNGGGALARILARSPAGPAIGRKHARYVERLTRSFDRGDWDQALRGAISLGGAAGRLTLRLPRPRSGALRPSPARGGAGGSVPFGPTVHEHLRETYTRAARQLEKDGQHLLAAFVCADLLDQVGAAVDLLERQGLYVEAAELAEARSLDPSYAVRLWWRAGQRDRALRVAVARGAFASALARLGNDDEAAAIELRRAWIRERRDAGDHLGAVTAAWPVTDLRDEVIPDIAAAVGTGGQAGGEALAHLLEHRPSDEAVEMGRRLLTPSPDVTLDAARGSFLKTLSTRAVSQPTWDRELSSLALDTLLRADAVIDGAFPDVVARLQKRADPVLVADLPRLKPPVWTLDEPLDIDLTSTGSLPIYDAAPLGHNSLLVALGELGVRLLTRDGRVKARWEVPTHKLVVSDHGNRALLITDRAPRYPVHQLDLPTGRARSLPPLDVMPLTTYDGSRPVLVSRRGIEWVEAHGDRWRLTWRELTEPGQVAYQVARTAESMAALFTDNGEINIWQWTLPSMTLRTRTKIEHAEDMAVVASGEVARLEQNSGVATLDWHAPWGNRLTTDTSFPQGRQHLLVSGESFAVLDVAEEAATMTVHAQRESPVSATLRIPPETGAIFRSWNGLALAGHVRGRLVVLDTVRHQVLVNVTVQE